MASHAYAKNPYTIAKMINGASDLASPQRVRDATAPNPAEVIKRMSRGKRPSDRWPKVTWPTTDIRFMIASRVAPNLELRPTAEAYVGR